MSAFEDSSRESKLIFLWIFTAVAALFTIATTFFLVGDVRGGEATATVVHVYSQQAYSISFVTKDGRRCQAADHKWEPRTGTINVSDTFQVHYSDISPCYNVRRADDPSDRFSYTIGPVMLAAGIVLLLLLRGGRTKDDRYHGPPRF